LARVPTLVYQGKVIEQPGRHRGGAESTNTIVEDVAAEKIIARIILPAVTIKKDPRSIW
jgi:hypothetical protein